MNIQNFKRALIGKANELRNSQISKEQIAIRRQSPGVGAADQHRFGP